MNMENNKTELLPFNIEEARKRPWAVRLADGTKPDSWTYRLHVASDGEVYKESFQLKVYAPYPPFLRYVEESDLRLVPVESK